MHRERGEGSRLRLLQRVPGGCRRIERLACRGRPRRPQRLELVRRQLAEAGERGLARKGTDHDQLGCGVDAARERERVDQLQLVVEVVLEPEHDLRAVVQRVE
jgi:hypothetical protein